MSAVAGCAATADTPKNENLFSGQFTWQTPDVSFVKRLLDKRFTKNTICFSALDLVLQRFALKPAPVVFVRALLRTTPTETTWFKHLQNAVKDYFESFVQQRFQNELKG